MAKFTHVMSKAEYDDHGGNPPVPGVTAAQYEAFGRRALSTVASHVAAIRATGPLDETRSPEASARELCALVANCLGESALQAAGQPALADNIVTRTNALLDSILEAMGEFRAASNSLEAERQKRVTMDHEVKRLRAIETRSQEAVALLRILQHSAGMSQSASDGLEHFLSKWAAEDLPF